MAGPEPGATDGVGALHMKAMILAAGRGARLRPETDRSPKPLLQVGGEPLPVAISGVRSGACAIVPL